MSKLVLNTLWGWRKGEDTPELLEAWDSYSAEEVNPEGWKAACQKALEACGDDLYSHRYLDLMVDARSIFAAFETPTVEAEVS